ncbi:MAG: ATPase domain-containing protein [Promethearchaeota archaeon]
MPKRNLIPSGVLSLDEALEGGLGEGEILHIFGPGGVGKTTLAIQFAINTAQRGNRVFYINLEGKFPLIRLRQMTSSQFSQISPLITIVSPVNFKEQSKLVSNLDSILSPDVKLLVFDTIVSHYRREYGPNTDNVMLNRKLNQQFGLIASAARSSNFAVIVLNQVRGDIDNETNFLPVAESVTSYWGTYHLQIIRAESKGYREFKLTKRDNSESKILIVHLQLAGFR